MTPSTRGPENAASRGADDEHVLNAAGEFDVHDRPIDLRAYRFEDWIAFVFFWALGATVFYQFFTRYALNDSAGWTEEIARYLLICVVYIGAAVAVRKNNHIQVDFVYRWLPHAGGRALATAVDLFRLAFLLYATWLTWLLIGKIGRTRMAVVDLPMGLVYSVVLVGFALMSFRAAGVLIQNWRRGASVLERPELQDEAR